MGGVEVITIAEGGADVDELLSLGCPIELLSAQAPLRQSIRELEAVLLAGQGNKQANKQGNGWSNRPDGSAFPRGTRP
jgi:hypothetical protein